MPHCPKCGKEVRESAKFCRACGLELKDRGALEAPTALSAPASKCAIHPSRDSVGVCASCGNTVCDLCRTISDNKITCTSCINKMFTRSPISEESIGIDNNRERANILPVERESGRSVSKTFCQSCGRQAQTKHVAYYKNIGMLIIRQSGSVKGDFCKECANAFFWSYTLTTLFVGWFGVISLMITPFYILNNIVYYIRTLRMEPP